MRWIKTENIPSWVYNGNYHYWTMSAYNDSTSSVYIISRSGDATNAGVPDIPYDVSLAVRPVITLKKSAI